MMLAASQLQHADHIVLIGYFVLMLGIGAYFYRYMRGMKDYFSGGNRIPWWLSGVSFYMSSFSVAAFVQYSALAYLYGWVAVTLYWVTVPATLISVIFFSSRWRRARIDSPVEYLENRYNSVTRQLFAWQGIPVRIIDDALKLVAIAMFISPVLGWSLPQGMLVSGLVMLTYTFMGGLWAVTVTDFVQFVVMAAAVVVLLPLSLTESGGLTGFIDAAPEGFFRLTHPEYGWPYLIANVVLFSLAFSSLQWSLIQRYYCVPKERDARKVGWLVVVLNFIGPPLMFLPAMAARQWLPEATAGKDVYPLLCAHLLPAGMLGLIMAAMFAATMSMLSSDYNVCASVLTNDVYRRLIRPSASQKHLVWVGRVMTLLIGVISLGTALAIGDVGGEGLFRSMIKLFSVATAPVAIPMIAGLLSRRVHAAAALSGFVVGVTTGLVLFFVCEDAIRWLDATWKKETIILFSTTAATLAALLLACRFRQSGSLERERSEEFMTRLGAPIGELDADRVQIAGGAISPFRVVGVCILLLGLLMLGVLLCVTDPTAWKLDLAIGLALTILGTVMFLTSKWSERAQEETA
jgi:SSS family transporter